MDFDKKYYKVKISVQIGLDGNAVYNIGDMQERRPPMPNGSSANGSAHARESSFHETLSQKETDVKRKFSIDDEDYLLAVQAGGMDAAQEMVDEAAQKLRHEIDGHLCEICGRNLRGRLCRSPARQYRVALDIAKADDGRMIAYALNGKQEGLAT